MTGSSSSKESEFKMSQKRSDDSIISVDIDSLKNVSLLVDSSVIPSIPQDNLEGKFTVNKNKLTVVTVGEEESNKQKFDVDLGGQSESLLHSEQLDIQVVCMEEILQSEQSSIQNSTLSPSLSIYQNKNEETDNLIEKQCEDKDAPRSWKFGDIKNYKNNDLDANILLNSENMPEKFSPKLTELSSPCKVNIKHQGDENDIDMTEKDPFVESGTESGNSIDNCDTKIETIHLKPVCLLEKVQYYDSLEDTENIMRNTKRYTHFRRNFEITTLKDFEGEWMTVKSIKQNTEKTIPEIGIGAKWIVSGNFQHFTRQTLPYQVMRIDKIENKANSQSQSSKSKPKIIKNRNSEESKVIPVHAKSKVKKNNMKKMKKKVTKRKKPRLPAESSVDETLKDIPDYFKDMETEEDLDFNQLANILKNKKGELDLSELSDKANKHTLNAVEKQLFEALKLQKKKMKNARSSFESAKINHRKSSRDNNKETDIDFCIQLNRSDFIGADMHTNMYVKHSESSLKDRNLPKNKRKFKQLHNPSYKSSSSLSHYIETKLFHEHIPNENEKEIDNVILTTSPSLEHELIVKRTDAKKKSKHSKNKTRSIDSNEKVSNSSQLKLKLKDKLLKAKKLCKKKNREKYQTLSSKIENPPTTNVKSTSSTPSNASFREYSPRPCYKIGKKFYFLVPKIENLAMGDILSPMISKQLQLNEQHDTIESKINLRDRRILSIEMRTGCRIFLPQGYKVTEFKGRQFYKIGIEGGSNKDIIDALELLTTLVPQLIYRSIMPRFVGMSYRWHNSFQSPIVRCYPKPAKFTHKHFSNFKAKAFKSQIKAVSNRMGINHETFYLSKGNTRKKSFTFDQGCRRISIKPRPSLLENIFCHNTSNINFKSRTLSSRFPRCKMNILSSLISNSHIEDQHVNSGDNYDETTSKQDSTKMFDSQKASSSITTNVTNACTLRKSRHNFSCGDEPTDSLQSTCTNYAHVSSCSDISYTKATATTINFEDKITSPKCNSPLQSQMTCEQTRGKLLSRSSFSSSDTKAEILSKSILITKSNSLSTSPIEDDKNTILFHDQKQDLKIMSNEFPPHEISVHESKPIDSSLSPTRISSLTCPLSDNKNEIQIQETIGQNQSYLVDEKNHAAFLDAEPISSSLTVDCHGITPSITAKCNQFLPETHCNQIFNWQNLNAENINQKAPNVDVELPDPDKTQCEVYLSSSKSSGVSENSAKSFYQEGLVLMSCRTTINISNHSESDRIDSIEQKETINCPSSFNKLNSSYESVYTHSASINDMSHISDSNNYDKNMSTFESDLFKLDYTVFISKEDVSSEDYNFQIDFYKSLILKKNRYSENVLRLIVSKDDLSAVMECRQTISSARLFRHSSDGSMKCQRLKIVTQNFNVIILKTESIPTSENNISIVRAHVKYSNYKKLVKASKVIASLM